MKFLFLLTIYFTSLFAFSQNEEKVTIYWKDGVKVYEICYNIDDLLFKKEKYVFNYGFTNDVITSIDYECHLYNEVPVYRYGFSWDILYDATIALCFFRELIDENRIFQKSVLLYQDRDDFATIGSVQNIYYRGGKEVDYEPGEYYYDFPADPDSIFNAIPKELGLPDTLLHIKYKQPWME